MSVSSHGDRGKHGEAEGLSFQNVTHSGLPLTIVSDGGAFDLS